jgi:hypothetical protein
MERRIQSARRPFALQIPPVAFCTIHPDLSSGCIMPPTRPDRPSDTRRSPSGQGRDRQKPPKMVPTAAMHDMAPAYTRANPIASVEQLLLVIISKINW